MESPIPSSEILEPRDQAVLKAIEERKTEESLPDPDSEAIGEPKIEESLPHPDPDDFEVLYIAKDFYYPPIAFQTVQGPQPNPDILEVYTCASDQDVATPSFKEPREDYYSFCPKSDLVGNVVHNPDTTQLGRHTTVIPGHPRHHDFLTDSECLKSDPAPIPALEEANVPDPYDPNDPAYLIGLDVNTPSNTMLERHRGLVTGPGRVPVFCRDFNQHKWKADLPLAMICLRGEELKQNGSKEYEEYREFYINSKKFNISGQDSKTNETLARLAEKLEEVVQDEALLRRSTSEESLTETEIIVIHCTPFIGFYDDTPALQRKSCRQYPSGTVSPLEVLGLIHHCGIIKGQPETYPRETERRKGRPAGEDTEDPEMQADDSDIESDFDQDIRIPNPENEHDINPETLKRLRADYLNLKRNPIPDVWAEMDEKNILKWHFVFRGQASTPYFGGFYHGLIIFPEEFPFRPPKLNLITPNGRFKVHHSICLSNSEHHPDLWNPSWSVSSILIGLLSFMAEDTPTLGCADTTTLDKVKLAYKSLDFCLADMGLKRLFPDVVAEIKFARKQMTELPAPRGGKKRGHK